MGAAWKTDGVILEGCCCGAGLLEGGDAIWVIWFIPPAEGVEPMCPIGAMLCWS